MGPLWCFPQERKDDVIYDVAPRYTHPDIEFSFAFWERESRWDVELAAKRLIHSAVWNNNILLLRAVLRRGVSPNAELPRWGAVLSVAMRYRRFNAIRTLLDANVDIPSDVHTTLTDGNDEDRFFWLREAYIRKDIAQRLPHSWKLWHATLLEIAGGYLSKDVLSIIFIH